MGMEDQNIEGRAEGMGLGMERVEGSEVTSGKGELGCWLCL